MDVVRYADTAGDNVDYPVPELHLHRDYIIDAFTFDKPFDRFIHEQLAGDILAREGGADNYAERVVATGFLALSPRYGTGPFELWHLTLENTIETVGQAFLGLNLKCARCHDHKFDPLTMRDYYGLYGIFSCTEFPWAGSGEVQSKQFNRQKFVALIPDAAARPKWDAWERQMVDLAAPLRLPHRRFLAHRHVRSEAAAPRTPRAAHPRRPTRRRRAPRHSRPPPDPRHRSWQLWRGLARAFRPWHGAGREGRPPSLLRLRSPLHPRILRHPEIRTGLPESRRPDRHPARRNEPE